MNQFNHHFLTALQGVSQQSISVNDVLNVIWEIEICPPPWLLCGEETFAILCTQKKNTSSFILLLNRFFKCYILKLKVFIA